MATEKQIAANRANGAKGGPKTEQGKTRCKYNATKHGLACKTAVVLRNESEDEFRTLHQQFQDSINPESGLESALVIKLANAYWKGQRKDQAESGLLLMEILKEQKSIQEECDKVGKSTDHVTPGEYLGLAFLRNVNSIAKFLRYAASIDREFNKTMDQLVRLIKLRNTLQPAETPAEPAAAEPLSAQTASTASEEIGSVLQNQPTTAPASPAPPLVAPANSLTAGHDPSPTTYTGKELA